MKKIIAVIPITVLFILLFNSVNIHAASSHYVITFSQGEYNNRVRWTAKLWNCSSTSKVIQNQNGSFNITNAYTNIEPEYNAESYDSLGDAISKIMTKVGNLPDSFVGRTYTTYEENFILNNVSYEVYDPPTGFYPSLEDFENAMNPPEPWYSEMWDTLQEELGNPAFWFGQWFIDLIDNIFGDDNEPSGPPKPPNSTHVQINNPTITPAPTPQPYSTVIIPKTDPVTGDTYYETNYIYNNPSGTPIVQPYPPTQSPTTGSPNSGDNYIPVGGDPYSIPIVNWLTSATIGDSNYDGLDSVGSGLDSIDVIGSDYNDGMSAVQDSTGTLPTSWLLLIGVAAAIPLVAGLISRFLS